MIDELYMGNIRTASALATLTGLTPSAMSYHLRALEKWGIIRRADATTDARERPWQRSARALTWEGESATPGTRDAIIGLYLDRLGRDLAASAAASAQLPASWQEAAVITRGFPWLTPQEINDVTAAVHQTLERAKSRTEDDHPPDARRVTYVLAIAPLVNDPPPLSAAPLRPTQVGAAASTRRR